jgi:hypothetical protein
VIPTIVRATGETPSRRFPAIPERKARDTGWRCLIAVLMVSRSCLLGRRWPVVAVLGSSRLLVPQSAFAARTFTPPATTLALVGCELAFALLSAP